jgi:CMP-N-acetylneuraminic acid synthetase
LRIIGLIPARGGSKGIPRKNLTLLGGKPLIQYTFEAALESKSLERVILSTDDPEIAGFAQRFGMEVPFSRPKALATDGASTRSVQRHALRWLKRHEGEMPEAVVTLQPTSPLRTWRHIDECVREFQERGVDSVISVTPVREHPYEVVGFANGRMFRPVKRPKGIVRRQQFPRYFHINGAVYVTRSSVLMEQDSDYGELVYGYEMDPQSSVDIDTPFDLRLAESLLGTLSEP